MWGERYTGEELRLGARAGQGHHQLWEAQRVAEMPKRAQHSQEGPVRIQVVTGKPSA
jgi:hypothetical protein